MKRLVSVEKKGYAPWADDETRRTSYTKRAVLPWNIIMMERGFILGFLLGIGNKNCITTNILSPIRDLKAKPLYFGNLKYQGLTSQIKLKILWQSSTAKSFNSRCNLCINEKISIITFEDYRLLLNERKELMFKCRHKSKFRLS